MNDKPDTMDELEVPAEIRVDAPAESRLDVPAEVRALAREHTTDAIDRLAGLLESEDHRVSLAAANALLDRGWGKVEPTADGTVMPTPPITVIRAPEIVADSEAWLEQYAPPRKPH